MQNPGGQNTRAERVKRGRKGAKGADGAATAVALRVALPNERLRCRPSWSRLQWVCAAKWQGRWA